MTHDHHIDTFGLTHVGKVRSTNEDQFLIACLRRSVEVRHTSLESVKAFEQLGATEAHVFVVADGVGGVPGGQFASGTAVQVLINYITHTMHCCYRFDVDGEHEFISQLERAIEHTHDRVQQEYGSTGRGPATTLTMVVLIWPRAYIVHVGDSRGYYLRRGRLKQFTRDQTMGEIMVDEGVMSEAEARDSGLDHVLASAIGADAKPSIGLLDLEWGDTLLLCTDGLTKHVTDVAIGEIMQQGAGAEDVCRELVNTALDRGGRDNITVAVGKMHGS
ncbi:MAG: serine/threonine-protein phosphatase [Gemmatimonadota bacterium]|nr:MAG: serine/threonine-protein phosphatase [Gemmatimonadota bacterium]